MRRLIAIVLMMSLGGCVEQILTVRSNPPGALCYLNGVEVGRTPLTHDFTWYGTYDVELRHDGYQTLKTTGNVRAPWWNWVPIDLVADLLPLHFRDQRHLHFGMKRQIETAAEPKVLLHRAAEMRNELESSIHTRAPMPATTRSTTQSTTRSTTRSTTLRSKNAPATTQNKP